MTEGIIEVHFENSDPKEYLATKENFVALNSFVNSSNPGKSKVRLGNDVVLISSIEKVEWKG